MERRTTFPRCGTQTSSLLLDAFNKVRKAIDDMVAQFLKEKEDEIKQKEFCVEEFNSTSCKLRGRIARSRMSLPKVKISSSQ